MEREARGPTEPARDRRWARPREESGRTERRGPGGEADVPRAGPDEAFRPVERAPYLPLRDYGIIGDMRTAALVGRDGSIDWCCFPRFDSPSAFARILDHRRGGHWAVRPRGELRSFQRYEPGTNVLVTCFRTPSGRLEVTDYMPAREWDLRAWAYLEIHRRVRALDGPVELETVFAPRFDYARARPRLQRRRHGVLASDHHETLALSSDLPWEWTVREGEEARGRAELPAGQEGWLVLRYDDDEVWPTSAYDAREKLERTHRLWREWVADIRYDGPYREAVERSALVLKLLFYRPTGAVVAAPTTSLPEDVRGARNWDYRFSWLRDSTYTLFGLYALGKHRESDSYMTYLKKVCREEKEGLQVMYGIGGERELPEQELGHLEGYRRSRPVRIGNAAVGQFQLDIYGEILDSVHIWRRNHEMTEGMWELCRRLVTEVTNRWREPDMGPWEARTNPHHWVFSKVMAWVAMDRAIRAAEELGLPADLERWRECRKAIRKDVLTLGWSERRQAFVQHYYTERMDAANLTIPLLRFLPHDDPRVRSTIERTVEELGHPSGLLYRYLTEDGVPGTEGAFWLNSFHLSQALALGGEHERAEEIFEKLLDYRSPLGLMSEEIDPDSGELLGNFPQAFSHIGLINAAHVLSRTRPRRTADDYALLNDVEED